MRYRTLGRTGLIVSELCLGTMTFGGAGFWKVIGGQTVDEATELVKGAFNRGVNFFDTANVYANGLSESYLGQAIGRLPRDEIVIATKAHGRIMMDPSDPVAARRNSARNTSGLSRKHLFDAVDASLKRLGTDFIDLYQVHGFDPITPLEETLEALGDIVRSGRVRYLGLCNMAAWQITKALWIADKLGLPRFESCQMYYTLAGRDLEREIVPLAQDQGLAILPWSPLAGGLLSGKFAKGQAGPHDSRRTTFDFPPIDKDRAFACVDAMRPMAEARGCSPARIALAWLLHQRHVTSVIIGAKTMDQLDDNLAAVTVKLTAEELSALDQVSALPSEYPAWMLARQGGDRAGQVS
jgi:aryl-alcohol dehydrogenase-like predicted oxidoreductase